jgi:hypothetical protein
MSVIALFRSVLIASIVMSILSIVAGATLSQNLNITEVEPSNIQGFFAVAILILSIISIVGLWKIKKWARTIFVIVTLMIIMISPTLGDINMNAWESMFNDISIMLEGILIAMMYSGKTKEEFEKIPNEI